MILTYQRVGYFNKLNINMNKKIQIIIVVFLAFFSCKGQEDPIQFSEAALNDMFVSLDGDNIAFKEILESNMGSTLVIDVWASWCSDCIKGMKKVKTLQQENKDVTYIFLSLDRSQEAWKAGIDKYKVEGTHYFMQSGWKGPFGEFIKLSWIPRYMVVDGQGHIKLYNAIEADDVKIKQNL